MRRSPALAVALAVLAGSFAGRAAHGEDEPRTLAVVVDRSASLRYADPRGEGRLALAFALGLAAPARAPLSVLSPGEKPVTASASSLEALLPAFRAILADPRRAGGSDLIASFGKAVELAKANGLVVAYTQDELDVVDENGRAPEALLEKARKKGTPDRNAVNEAAREALAAAVPAASLSKRFFALRAPLPREARSVPFLEKLGAEAIELEPGRPLETARTLATALGARDLASPRSVVLEGPKETLKAEPGSRVAILADRSVGISGKVAVAALDSEKRAFLVDTQDGNVEVEGEKGTRIASLSLVRSTLTIAARAFRTAKHEAYVEVVPSAPSPGLVVNAKAGTAEKALVEKTGRWIGRLEIEESAQVVNVSATFDGRPLPPIEARIAGAAVHVEAASPATALEPVALSGKLDQGLPDELVPGRFTLKLRSGAGDEVSAELVRRDASFAGEVTFPKPGTYSLARAEAGELDVGLASPIEVGAAPALIVKRLGEPGPLALRDGAAELEIELELSPAPAKPTPVVFSLSGIQGEAESETRALSGKGRFLVRIHAPSAERTSACELVATAKLAHGEAKASLPLDLEVQPWKKIAAAALIAFALLWLVVVLARKRSLARRWGEKQLRGIGTNGKMSYERYLLREHLVSRRAAVAPQGATAARVEIDAQGRTVARAVEGSQLLAIEAKPKPRGEIKLVHETPFAVVRGLYDRRYVYLEREPTADELAKRYVPEAVSTEGSDARDSDMIVLLGEKENLVPPSQRIVPVESARLPKVEAVQDLDSDEHVVIADSYEAKVLDSQHLVLDPGQSSSAGPVPIIDAGSSDEGGTPSAFAEGRSGPPPILDAGSSDEGSARPPSDQARNDHLLLDSRASSDEAPTISQLESVDDVAASGDTDMGPVDNLSESETSSQDPDA